MALIRSSLWILPVILVATADLVLRREEFADWAIWDLGIYAVSCLLALAWVRLSAGIAAALRYRHIIAFWFCIGALSVWSAVLLFIHAAYYIQFGGHINAVAFNDFLIALQNTPETVESLFTANRQLWVLALTVGFLPLWRLSMRKTPKRGPRKVKLLAPLLLAVILSAALIPNMTLSRGNFLPSINVLMSFSRAALFQIEINVGNGSGAG